MKKNTILFSCFLFFAILNGFSQNGLRILLDLSSNTGPFVSGGNIQIKNIIDQSSMPTHFGGNAQGDYFIEYSLVSQSNPAINYSLGSQNTEVYGHTTDATENNWWTYSSDVNTIVSQINYNYTIPCIPSGNYYLNAVVYIAEFIPLDGNNPSYMTNDPITLYSYNNLNTLISVTSNYPYTTNPVGNLDHLLAPSITTSSGNTLSGLNLTPTPICTTTGSITAAAVGGVNPIMYTYQQNGGSANPNALSAGLVTVTATDNNGCKVMNTATINRKISVSSTNTVDPCGIGSITISQTGGTGSITYKAQKTSPTPVGPVLTQTTPTFTGLTPGTYTLTVLDGSGCTSTATATLTSTINMSGFEYNTGNFTVPSNGYVFTDLAPTGVIKVYGTITIPNGVTVNVSNKTFEFISKTGTMAVGETRSGFIIEKGGTLNATGCTFKGSSSCSNMWDGLQVWGDASLQGNLNLTNCQIQDAYIGVAVYRVNPPSGTATESGLGLLSATSCTFLNNRVGVDFTTLTKINNLSNVSFCTFTCNSLMKDGYLYPAEGISKYINLTNVIGTQIIGNTFTGYSTLAVNKRGIGVASTNASYTVQSGLPGNVPVGNPEIQNVFTNLFKGIDAFCSYNAKGGPAIKIKNNYFNNTYQGIIGNGGDFTEVSFNTFNVPLGSSTLNSWGMYFLSNYRAYVTENVFNTISTAGTYTYGLIVNTNFTATSNIYRNTFNGNFTAATQFELNNSMVQARCNKYLGTNTYDWNISSGSLANQGVTTAGNGNAGAAANTFGSCTGGNSSQINNLGTAFSYVTQPGLNPINCYSSSSITIVNTSNSNSCPQLIATPPGSTNGLVLAPNGPGNDLQSKLIIENNVSENIPVIMASETDFTSIDAETFHNSVIMPEKSESNFASSGVNSLNQVTVFPNPTNDKVTIDFSDLEIEKIVVYDMLGNVIYTTHVTDHSNEYTVDLSNQTNGIFLIKLFSNNEVIVKKVIKK